MITLENIVAQPIEFLQNIVSKGGPELHEYDALYAIADELNEEYKAGNIAEIDLKLMRDSFGHESMETTLHGHSLTKPYGYAGDFMIIDKIYRNHITPEKRFEKWDKLWQSNAACQAVRNRKDYFIKTIMNRLGKDETIDVLNVASGPARDLADLYTRIGKGRVNTVCIEADGRAISYAKELNEANMDEITFIEKNIFKYETDKKHNVIWSAGLFDYFNDSIFVKILKRFVSWTKEGGEVIIGNFGLYNPSRAFMELFGDWYLLHRSEEHLIGLAMQAGIKRENIRVEQEEEGVNLFLHILV
jgi:extracellular factor (EF) 3-hydroxypalmitic acid methyl ester biosynthesis protein